MFMKPTYRTIPILFWSYMSYISPPVSAYVTKAGADPYATFGVRKICVRKPSNRVAGCRGEMTEMSSIADFDFEKQMDLEV